MKRTLPFATKLNRTVQQAFLNQSLDPPHPWIKNTGSAPDIRPVTLETLNKSTQLCSTTYMISPAFNSNSGGGLTITYECPGLCWKSAALTEWKNKNKNV